MSKDSLYRDQLSEDFFEPAWPYDLADSYMEQDLGAEEEAQLKGEGVSLIIFRRPWFKQNYRTLPKRNLRLYRRPYFHVAEE
jgi:hypothetical protein